MPPTRPSARLLSLDDLMSDPLRPLGLTDVADLTAPWITLDQWGQWHRRGLLPDPRWTVSRCPAWAACDVAGMLRDMVLHLIDGRATRCGRTCQHCTAGDAPATWVEHAARMSN